MAVFPQPIFDRWRAYDMGARQRASAYWREHLERDPFLERAYLVVEMVMGGRTYSVARQAVTTTRGSTGERINFLPALVAEPSVTQAISFGSQAASARSVSVEVPGWLIKTNDSMSDGYIMAGAAEVSLVLDGGDYDLRWVLLRGSITGGPALGDDSETIAVQITDPRDLQQRKIPEQVVDSTSWPLAQDAAVGQRIPRIYNGATATPTYRVLDDHGSTGLYFAVCDTPDDLQVSSLWVNGTLVAPGDPTYGYTSGGSKVQDGLGRPILVTDHSASSGPWEDNDAVNVTLERASGVASRSVLQIAREILSNYTSTGPLGLNLDLWSYAETRMDPTAPHVVINAAGSRAPGGLEFVEGGLLDCYPMVHLLYAGAGLGAAVVDRRPGPGDEGVVGEWTVGRFPVIDRESPYQETAKAELYTAFEVRYNYNPMRRAYGGVVRRDTDNSPACRLAEQVLGGPRPYDTIESPYIVSQQEAEYVAEWLVAHRCVPFYRVEMACLPWVHLRHRVGDLIRLTDPEFSIITRAPATIESMTYERGNHLVTLMVWHPAILASMASNPY